MIFYKTIYYIDNTNSLKIVFVSKKMIFMTLWKYSIYPMYIMHQCIILQIETNVSVISCVMPSLVYVDRVRAEIESLSNISRNDYSIVKML